MTPNALAEVFDAKHHSMEVVDRGRAVDAMLGAGPGLIFRCLLFGQKAFVVMGTIRQWTTRGRAMLIFHEART